MCRDGEGRKGCRHKYPERGEVRVPIVEGEGGAQGERERATATAFAVRYSMKGFTAHGHGPFGGRGLGKWVNGGPVGRAAGEHQFQRATAELGRHCV